MEGNASVYQVNYVSRITVEGRAEFLRTWGPGFDQKGAGVGGGGTGGVAQFGCGNYKSFIKAINLTVLEIMHQFIMGGAGAGRAGQPNLCVETMHPYRSKISHIYLSNNSSYRSTILCSYSSQQWVSIGSVVSLL